MPVDVYAAEYNIVSVQSAVTYQGLSGLDNKQSCSGACKSVSRLPAWSGPEDPLPGLHMALILL